MKGLPSGPVTVPVIVAPNAVDASETVNASDASSLFIGRMIPPVGAQIIKAWESYIMCLGTRKGLLAPVTKEPAGTGRRSFHARRRP